MDYSGDATQLIFAITTALVFGRLGFALARRIERRATGKAALPPEADERLRGLEEECGLLRQELTDVQERQDFTERALLQDPARTRPPAPPLSRERIVTPR